MTDTTTMRAWWVNDCECYAGRTKEEALAAAMKDSGLKDEDDNYSPIDEITEAPEGQTMWDGEWPGDGKKLNIRDEAAKMTEPGFICGTEY